MTEQHAIDEYHGGQRWTVPHCPDCGAEDPADCCTDAEDRERYAALLRDLRAQAHGEARRAKLRGWTRERWLDDALRSGRTYARELPARELEAVAEIAWGALGARGGG